jgi:hypothetical protein
VMIGDDLVGSGLVAQFGKAWWQYHWREHPSDRARCEEN